MTRLQPLMSCFNIRNACLQLMRKLVTFNIKILHIQQTYIAELQNSCGYHHAKFFRYSSNFKQVLQGLRLPLAPTLVYIYIYIYIYLYIYVYTYHVHKLDKRKAQAEVACRHLRSTLAMPAIMQTTLRAFTLQQFFLKKCFKFHIFDLYLLMFCFAINIVVFYVHLFIPTK